MLIENEYNAMLKLLSNDGGHIKLNKKLILLVGLEAACVYSELFNLQCEALKKNEWQLIGTSPCFSVPTDKLCASLGISAHKQRTILQILQGKKLIAVHYGNGNTRMITILADYYNLYELLNPTKSSKQVLYENFVLNISNIKKLLLQNMKSTSKNNLSDLEKELLEYLSNYSNNTTSQFEKKLIQFIGNETVENELKKEYDKVCI